MRSAFRKFADTIIPLLLLMLGTPAWAQDAALIFSAMGDVPYSSTDETTLQKQITDHNKYSPSEFMVHLGDIKPGGGGCPESVYQTVAGYLLNLKVPTFIVPGDNEWTGCSDWDQAWSYWEEYFMGFEQNFCGAPSVERQAVRPENFAWIKKGVLLIGINMPGGNKKNPELWDQRLQDNADWVVQQFQDHASDVRAAVIFAHSMKRVQDALFFDQFRPAAAAFAKPILYIHGNDHGWTMDRPLPEQNVLRVCVDEGGQALPVEVTVTLNTQNMFTFDRVPWNSNSQPINYDPCAVPGPDITVNPTMNNYGQVQVGSNATKTFVVSNTGNENLDVTEVTLAGTDPGEFHIDSGGGAFTLTPSANRNVVVRFAPSAEGGENAILRFASNDPDEDPFEVSLIGTGVVFQPPVISSFSPSSGAPGIEVTILGSNFNGATQVAFGGTASSNFVIDSNTQILADVPSGAVTGKITVTTPGGTATSNNDFTVTAPPPTTTFTPAHDAYVKSTEATATFGSASTLRLRQSSTILNSYLKFEISGLSASVQSAKLRLFVTSASNSGGSVYLVSNNYSGNSTAWTESGLTYSNAPAMSGSPLSTVGSVSSGQWVEFDVTAAIAGNGTYSFGLKNTSSTTVQYSSKEGANDPELVIETGSGPPPPPPTPALSINNVSVNEGDVGTVNAVFTVTLSATSSQEVSVDYATADGSATAGDDYLADAGSITFSPGTTAQTITIVVNSDVLDEADENFLVNLSNPANATIDDGQGSGTIVDDDGSSGGGSPNTFNPVHDAYVKSTEASANFGSASTLRLRQSSTILNSYLKFEISGLSASVHSAKLRLFVTSASNSGGSVYPVSNNYAGSSTAWTESGLTYSNAPAMSGSPLSTVGSVSSGQWVEFDVTAAIAGNGTYSFGLKNTSSTTVQYSSKEGANDPELVIETGSGPPPPPPTPALSINNVSVNEGDVGTVNAVFTVTLSATSTQEVSVDYATADGSATAGDDYLADTGSITFSPGTTTQTITIVVNSDVLDESDENFLVNLSNPAHATIDDGQGSGTIVDDDGSSGGGSPNTFNPTDDAYVRMSSPTSTSPNSSSLRVRKTSSETILSFLKFEVSGIAGVVQSAKLRLFATDASTDGGSVYAVSNDYRDTTTPWVQSGLNWNNAPLIRGTALSSAGAVSAGAWVELEVTSVITGNGIYSFALQNNSSDVVYYTSREGTSRPELVIQTGSSKIASHAAMDEVAATVTAPERFNLGQNYPNPFNPSTTISFALPEVGHVTLRIHSLTGQLVRELTNDSYSPGSHRVIWDARDENGQQVATGVYFYQLVVLGQDGQSTFTQTRRMLFMK